MGLDCVVQLNPAPVKVDISEVSPPEGEFKEDVGPGKPLDSTESRNNVCTDVSFPRGK
jgi:hypothetical protein